MTLPYFLAVPAIVNAYPNAKYDLRESSIGSIPTLITQCPALLQQTTNSEYQNSLHSFIKNSSRHLSASEIILTLINYTTKKSYASVFSITYMQM